jgi:hypothetical protein
VPDQPALPELNELYLWPENQDAWTIFKLVQTEWRGGMQREGLDKSGVRAVIDQRRAWRTRRRARFGDIQVMERACLDEWAQRAAADAAKG